MAAVSLPDFPASSSRFRMLSACCAKTAVAETTKPGLLSRAPTLNLAGILTPGPKIAALTGNRVLYRDGVPMASLVAGDVTFFEEFEPATQWQVRQALLRGAEHAPSLAPPIGAAFDREEAPTTSDEAS